jgi:serine/threonine protein kinase
MSHGDIKPQNILVSAECVKLTDFGSSVLPEDMYARTRENGGTILYSAPEIVGVTLSTRDATARFLSDIYSLGVLLYHLVTARLPHDTLSQVARHRTVSRAPARSTPPYHRLSTNLSTHCLEARADRPMADYRWDAGGVSRGATRPTPVHSHAHCLRQCSVRRKRIGPPRQFVSLIAGDYRDAEIVARAEFEASRDHARLLADGPGIISGRAATSTVSETSRPVPTSSTQLRPLAPSFGASRSRRTSRCVRSITRARSLGDVWPRRPKRQTSYSSTHRSLRSTPSMRTLLIS